ncbi:MAG: 2-oxo acid dehydrogenase subunit E2 [Prolixibacteraceae bacterium]|nr:2-oxo acid dehydrogenase subunit E2 [Prolixibacteraceae bacterium]
MPRQGQSVETCIFGQWYKNVGDEIKEGDLLFSYETDKASFEEESKTEGILLATFFEEGDEVPVLVNVAVIGEKGESVKEFLPGQVQKEKTTETVITEEKISEKENIEDVPVKTNGRIKISPLALKMAQSANIDTSSLSGSGPNGRIIARDVEAASKKPAPSKKEKIEELISGDDFEIKPVTNMRKLIAKAMHNSLQNSAQLTHHMSADVRKLLDFREKVKIAMKKRELRVNVTLNSMICLCVVRALKKHPDVNSHFLGETIKTFNKVHLGIAVDTRNGLMVPTVKNADDLPIVELARQIEDLRMKSISRKINPDLLLNDSASFSVSNLEGFGVEMFTPVINLPQVAILGVNTIIHRPVEVSKGVIGFVPYIGLSLTYDHRALDGGPATMFLASVKKEIENFDQTL